MYPMGFFWDPTMIILIPGLLFALWAQYMIKSTFAKYSNIHSSRNITGAEAAKEIARRKITGTNIPVEHISGNLTDHYDPRQKVLRLSDSVYGSTSIAAIGVAAHEVGHAIQHNEGYLPLILRNSIVPVVNLSSTMAFPIFFIGLLIKSGTMLDVGIILFSAALVFHLITLPVEINASTRAVSILRNTGMLSEQELSGVKKVLTAAALTYVASLAMSILQLLRLVLIRNSRR